jgi:Fe2+ transport system protein FeoA
VELALTDCAAGEEVELVETGVDGGLAVRLREMGLMAGAVVRVARQGSPMILEIGEARVCLRGEEAACITVRVPTFAKEACLVSAKPAAPASLVERPEWA